MLPGIQLSDPKSHLRDRIVIVGALMVLTTLTWYYTAMHGREIMLKGSISLCPPGSAPVDFAVLLAIWFVMMAAMMLPTIIPMVDAFALINRRRRDQAVPHVATAVFVAGYLLAWFAFSVFAMLLQVAMQSLGFLDPLMGQASGFSAAAMFAVAGLYQLSQLKKVCLSRCYSIHSFILSEWRDGPSGALIMGLRHGLFCVGCCAALMILVFVGSAMDLRWMVGLAVLVSVEKMLPHPELWRRLIGCGLLLTSTVILARTLIACGGSWAL
jgi:predicted metal-binding membrane protein